VAAVFTVQATIFFICVYKYWEDLILVVSGKGHIPYEEHYREDAKYFQSNQYQIDMQKDEMRSRKRRKIIEKAKKKTEEEVRPLFVGYYNDGTLDFETLNIEERIKIMEESKSSEGPVSRKRQNLSV